MVATTLLGSQSKDRHAGPDVVTSCRKASPGAPTRGLALIFLSGSALKENRHSLTFASYRSGKLSFAPRPGTAASRVDKLFSRAGNCAQIPRPYLIGREPMIRISTSLLALCRQSRLDEMKPTPTRALSRSPGSTSLRTSPLLMARFTNARIAS